MSYEKNGNRNSILRAALVGLLLSTCAIVADAYLYTPPSTGGGAPSGAAGGDLSGTYPNPAIKTSPTITTPTISGQLTVTDGTVSAPAVVSATGTPDTGSYFPAVDAWAVTTGGVLSLYADSAEHLGIGVAPTAVLDVLGTAYSGTPTGFGQALRVRAPTFTDSGTAISGTLAAYYNVSFTAPTLIAANTGVTTTTAGNVMISGPPIISTNETATFAAGLQINTTNVAGSGGAATYSYGIRANQPTGATTNRVASLINVGTSVSQLLLQSGSTAITTADVLGGIDYSSNDTNLTSPGNVVAMEQVLASGTHTAASLPSDFVWSTTPTGTITLAEVARLRGGLSAAATAGAGFFGVGTVAPAARIHFGGNIYGAVFTTNVGSGLRSDAATYTDSTTGAGTVAVIAANSLGVPTFVTAANAIAGTDTTNLYIANAVASTNVTAGLASSFVAGGPGVFINPTVGPSQIFLRSQRAAIINTNVLGGIDWSSDDTTLTAPGQKVAAIQAVASETHTATALGTRLAFFVTGPTQTATVEALRLVNASGAQTTSFQLTGAVANGTPSISLASSDANNSLQILPKGTGNVGLGTTTTASASGTGGTSTATCSQQRCVITTAALTTAGLASHVMTVTNTHVAATDIVLCSVAYGTSTTGEPTIGTVTPGAGTVVVQVRNAHATAAVNGTLVVSCVVF